MACFPSLFKQGRPPSLLPLLLTQHAACDRPRRNNAFLERLGLLGNAVVTLPHSRARRRYRSEAPPAPPPAFDAYAADGLAPSVARGAAVVGGGGALPESDEDEDAEGGWVEYAAGRNEPLGRGPRRTRRVAEARARVAAAAHSRAVEAAEPPAARPRRRHDGGAPAERTALSPAEIGELAPWALREFTGRELVLLPSTCATVVRRLLSPHRALRARELVGRCVRVAVRVCRVRLDVGLPSLSYDTSHLPRNRPSAPGVGSPSRSGWMGWPPTGPASPATRTARGMSSTCSSATSRFPARGATGRTPSGECDVRCAMCDVRCAMCDVRCVMCGVRCVACGVWRVTSGADVRCVMCDGRCVMRDFGCACRHAAAQ